MSASGTHNEHRPHPFTHVGPEVIKWGAKTYCVAY
jgi:hypothetical protein